ncbi:hypothetical protein ABPG72_014682 [Tetrahymena utriculariae]
MKYDILYELESAHLVYCSKDKSLPTIINDSDELVLSKFLFSPFQDEKIEIIIDLVENVYVGIQNLNVNILPCHPSCLECSGPEENQCTKCYKNNPIDGKCSDCNLYFQDGQCVNKCDESKFLFPYDQNQKICVYLLNCEKFEQGSCIQCKLESKYIFNGECVAACPIGYNNSQDSNNCEIDKQNIQNNQSRIVEIVKAFYNNFFSDLEVNTLNIKTSQFLSQNVLKRVTTQCGNRKILGGFLANKLNSQIEFEITSNNCKTVIFYFNFIIIDYVKDMDLDSFILNLNGSSEKILLSQCKNYEKSYICGDKTKEEYTYKYSKVYNIDLTKGVNQNINVQIINNNKYMDYQENIYSRKNKYPYFGISGLTAFCIQDLCEKNCLECDQKDQNVCIKCEDGFELDNNKKCIQVVKCDSQSYLDDSNKCRKCSDDQENCLECDSKNSCKKCSNSFILQNGKCVCDKEMYLNNKNECVKCSDSFPNCFQCSSNSCIKCNANYQLHNSQCFSCEKDKLTSNNSQCQECADQNCIFCWESTDKCEECQNGYKLNEQKCDEIKCGQNQFFNNSSKDCQLCNIKFENCDQCSQNECLNCIENYYYDKSTNRCVKNCPNGTFVDNKQCEFCKLKNCSQCSSSLKCLKCEDNYQLHNNQCFVCVKDEALFKFQNQCQKCNKDNCKKCFESTDICDECDDGYKLNQQNCEEILCKPNEFLDEQMQVCQPCSERYKNCSECSKKECKSCLNSLYLDKSSQECVKTCPKGTFEDHNKCLLCQHKNCQECDKNKCLSCQNGFYLYNQECQDNCDGLLIDKKGNRCYKSCVYPLKKQEKECIEKCKDGFYFNEEFRECQKCKSGCSLCEDKDICLSCEEGYEHNNFLNKCNEKQKPSEQEQNAQEICGYEDKYENICFNLYLELQGYGQIYDYLTIVSIIYLLFQLIFMPNEYTISLYFLLVTQLRGNSVFLLDETLIYYTQAFIKADYGFNVLNILPNMFQLSKQTILYEIKSFNSIWIVKNIFTDFLNNYFYQSILIGLIIISLLICKLLNLICNKLRTLTKYLCYKLLFLVIIISSNQLIVAVILQLQNESLNQVEFFISIPYTFIYITYFSFDIKNICFSELDSIQLEKLGAVCYKINQKRIQQVFWIVFETKKLISIAFILILPNKIIALAIDLIISSGFTIYIIISKPLIQQNQNLMIITLELLSLLAQLIQTILISELEISFSSFSSLLKTFAVALILMQILALSRGFIIFAYFIFQKFKICAKKSFSQQHLNQSSQLVSFNNIQLNTNTIFDILQQSEKSINLSKVSKKKYK